MLLDHVSYDYSHRLRVAQDESVVDLLGVQLGVHLGVVFFELVIVGDWYPSVGSAVVKLEEVQVLLYNLL